MFRNFFPLIFVFVSAQAIPPPNELAIPKSELSIRNCWVTLAPRAHPKTSFFAFLPDRLRSHLAQRSDGFREAQIAALQTEINNLMPESAVGFLAYMPQSSHRYLLWELATGPAQKSLSERRNSSEKPTTEDQDEFEAEWMSRMGRALPKIEELLALHQLSSDAVASQNDVALTHLSLALIYGFSYGFEHGIKRGLRGWEEISIAKHTGSFVARANEHFDEALRLMNTDKTTAWPKTVLKFLAGKHFVNATEAYANPGYFHFSGERVVPEKESYIFIEKALRLLQEVIDETAALIKGLPADSYSEIHEVHFEARAHLANAQIWPMKLNDPTGHGDFSLPLGLESEKILVDYLMVVPAGRAQKSLGDRYGIADRLLNRTRWAYRLRDEAKFQALFQLEKMIGSTNPGFYEALLAVLADHGHPQLRAKLDGVSKDMASEAAAHLR